jgi:hypothetical protein
MMLFSRARLQATTAATFADPASIGEAIGDVRVPDDIAAWLGRLRTLIGVPFGYLVPDEGMLPPESIRFFRLDTAWVEALLDGAFSLGRNLTAEAGGAEANLDAVLLGPALRAAREAAPRRRRAGAVEPASSATGGAAPWTGFLLRSTVVSAYPGLGVNAYEAGSTQPLPMRRLDRLGPGADTLFGLVEGEAHQVDVHEAAEVLHYGIDAYTAPAGGGPPTALKNLHTFTRLPDGTIQVDKDYTPVQIGASFRSRSPRVLKLTDLAAQIASANGTPAIDSAEMGFEMTEGVGMVSFVRSGP